MSGSPWNGPQSNIIGNDAVDVVLVLDASVGTNQSGSAPVSGRPTPLIVSWPASVIVADWFSRGSTKNSSACAPLFLIVTGTVTAVPAASFVLVRSGRPAALTLTLLNSTLPVNGCENSFPATGSVNATISVQVPRTGLRVYAVAVSVWVPLPLLCGERRSSPSGLTRD